MTLIGAEQTTSSLVVMIMVLNSWLYVKHICPGYNAGAYQRRNEWMVDHSSRVIAVFNGEPSGTKNTLDYAQCKEVTVKMING